MALVTNRTCYLIDMKNKFYQKHPLKNPLGNSHFDFNSMSTLCGDEHLSTKILLPHEPRKNIYGTKAVRLAGDVIKRKAPENLLARWFHFKGVCKNWQEAAS